MKLIELNITESARLYSVIKKGNEKSLFLRAFVSNFPLVIDK